jgi:hypothetical protein
MDECACQCVSCVMVSNGIRVGNLEHLAYLKAEFCLKTRVSRHPGC